MDNPQAAEFAGRERVFYYDRQELEHLAVTIDAILKWIYHPEVRSGERDNAYLLDSCDHYTAYCRELIAEADTQDRSDQDQPMASNEMALDRDAVRYMAYGIIHIMQCVKDGQEETQTGTEPQVALTQMSCGLWILVDLYEEEDREAVYARMDRIQTQLVEGAQPAMFKHLIIPGDWNPTGDIPEE